MTKEELEKEAYLYAKNSKDVQDFECGFDIAFKSYLASAEPREKRIAELEHQLTHRNCLDCSNHSSNLRMRNLALEKENAELRKVAEFQQSSNMSRHFENKKLKEGLAVGSILNKGLNSMNKALEEERDKYRNMVFDKDEQLTNAKELLNEFMRISKASDEDFEHDYSELIGDAEQFLSEVEK